MENFENEIEDIIKMFKQKDARGIDKVLYRYQDMGMGMLFIALYHALNNTEEEAPGFREKNNNG